MTRTIAAVLQAATSKLEAAGNSLAKLDAEYLLAYLLGCERVALYGHAADLSVSKQLQYDALVSRRMTGEPVAYITGTQGFWTLDLKVNEYTLIPRPDTETLVEVVLRRVKALVPTVLDLGTGSGCILLSLLSEWSEATGHGVDMSDGALKVADDNARNCGIGERATFSKSDWFTAVEKPTSGFSVIVSNPPYIPAADIDTLMPDVRNFEPLSALDGGTDGLNPYRVIAENACTFLAADGLLAVEVGIHQASDVAALFAENGLQDIEITRDLGGVDRVVSGKNIK